MTQLLHLEFGFKNLASAGYEETSKRTGRFPLPGAYNCIAWAANDPNKDHWWWPDLFGYWPSWIEPREVNILCFIRTFRWLGYRLCRSSRRELGFEKVALYAIHRDHRPTPVPMALQDLQKFWEPTHMARQLPDGAWTSKCGGNEDITHYTLDALESYGPIYGSGDEYGCPVLYMKRFILIAWIVRLVQWAHFKLST